MRSRRSGTRYPGGSGHSGALCAPPWAFQNKVCLRRVRGPRCGLVAPCGSGQPAAMRFAPFAASCPRGYRVDGAIVLVLCGPTAHRPASGGRDPVRKTADLAYNGRNSPAWRELKLFRDVYGVAPILREGPILLAIGTGGAGGRKRGLMARPPRPEPGSCGTPAPQDGAGGRRAPIDGRQRSGPGAHAPRALPRRETVPHPLTAPGTGAVVGVLGSR
jgi:hypothetical protein